MSRTCRHVLLLIPALAASLAAAACSRGGSTEYPDVGKIDGSEDEVVFQPGQVLTYRVSITQENLDSIEEHGIDEEWKSASLTVTGLKEGPLALGEVGFRHKGSVGTLTGCWSDPTVEDDPLTEEDEALLSRVRTYQDYCARLSYKLKLDKYVKTNRFHGLKKLNLHATQRDPTKLHELLAYSLFYDFGVDAPRAAPARLYIDVVDGAGTVTSSKLMGLFIAVEDVDDRYAKYHYVDADQGNLFKEAWPNPDLPAAWTEAGFASSLLDRLETNTSAPDVSDFVGFTAAVGSATPNGFAEAMAPSIDLDEMLRYMAVDRAIQNWDGVTAMYCWDAECSLFGPHNFYWYRDTGLEGRFHLVPWDLDNTFQGFDPYMHPLDPSMAERPVPDWNVKPADCAPVRVWADSHVAPPGCDAFLNLLASTQWDRYRTLGRELVRGPLRAGVLRRKAAAWSGLMEPILREDPYVDLETWRGARDELVGTILWNAAPAFDASLDEGYIDESP